LGRRRDSRRSRERGVPGRGAKCLSRSPVLCRGGHGPTLESISAEFTSKRRAVSWRGRGKTASRLTIGPADFCYDLGMMVCPRCQKPHENVRGKCPNPFCDEKHAVEPRDLPKDVKCAHGILRLLPCAKCGRSAEECKNYRPHFLTLLRDHLIRCGVDKSEAWERAEAYLADL
jgi:hypothetical protein